MNSCYKLYCKLTIKQQLLVKKHIPLHQNLYKINMNDFKLITKNKSLHNELIVIKRNKLRVI